MKQQQPLIVGKALSWTDDSAKPNQYINTVLNAFIGIIVLFVEAVVTWDAAPAGPTGQIANAASCFLEQFIIEELNAGHWEEKWSCMGEDLQDVCTQTLSRIDRRQGTIGKLATDSNSTAASVTTYIGALGIPVNRDLRNKTWRVKLKFLKPSTAFASGGAQNFVSHETKVGIKYIPALPGEESIELVYHPNSSESLHRIDFEGGRFKRIYTNTTKTLQKVKVYPTGDATKTLFMYDEDDLDIEAQEPEGELASIPGYGVEVEQDFPAGTFRLELHLSAAEADDVYLIKGDNGSVRVTP